MSRLYFLAATLLFAGVVGCGGDDSSLATVSGTVTYKNKPVAGASVTFQPENGKIANGTTDENGNFTLTTYKSNDGAAIGNHTVTIVATNLPSGDGSGENSTAMNKDLMEPIEGGDAIKSTKIPGKYADSSTSDLKFEVTSDGENKPEFVLKD